MAQKKPEPGLDQVLTDEAIDEFVARNELKVEREPVRRLWPVVCAVASGAWTFGVSAGIVVADSQLLSAMMLVISALVTAIATVVFFEARMDDSRGV
jgi:hypothetical protein